MPTETEQTMDTPRMTGMFGTPLGWYGWNGQEQGITTIYSG